MTNPFREAHDQVRGSGRLEQAARVSLLAAESKFGQTRPEPVLRLDLRSGRTLGVHDTAVVSMALQSATAKLAYVINDPAQERTQTRKSDRDRALLIPRAQLGPSLFFSFPPPESAIEVSLFDEFHTRSLSEAAAVELCSILPSSSDDDAALDAVVSQRTTVRSAVSDLVEAVRDTTIGISLDLAVMGHEGIHSEVSLEQAGVLHDALQEVRTDRRVQQLVGRLDGVRTRRRMFYLELNTGEEIPGAIGPDPVLMAKIRDNLDKEVLATVESERVETVAGRRGRPAYRLIDLEPQIGLFT